MNSFVSKEEFDNFVKENTGIVGEYNGEKMIPEAEVLKFYYIESEDKYVVGQRLDTMYYAEVTPTGLWFYMSRYLPWGEHVVSPNTLWKEHTYCSEPKEISFFEWLSGFMKKQGWEWQ